MTDKYLLSCSCGEKIPVEPRQAGEIIRCTCGASLDVPTMLQMRALERAKPPRAAQQTSAPWGARQAVLLLGIVIVLVALGLAIGLFLTRPISPTARLTPDVLDREVRDLSPFESWQRWQALRALGPAGRRLPGEEAYEKAFFQYCLWMGLVLTIAVVGIGLIVGAVLKTGGLPTAAVQGQTTGADKLPLAPVKSGRMRH